MKGQKTGISPYARGTTINKMANRIVEAMKWNSKLTFEGVYKAVMTPKIIATHNDGEFRRYPLKGDGSLKELMRLAVGKKLGKEIEG
jgi:hypothetical protein